MSQTKLKSKVKKLKATKTPKIIKRELVYVDPKMINVNSRHLKNEVVFSVFRSDIDPSVPSDELPISIKQKVVKHVCFSGLINKIYSDKANKIYYKLETVKKLNVPVDNKNDLLTAKEQTMWIRLAKRYKLLPAYINENAMQNGVGEFIIDVENLSPSILYIYLSVLRHIREDPCLPRAVLYLVNKIRMNFYAAYVFASACTMDYLGHHIINVQRPYGAFKAEYNSESRRYIRTITDNAFTDGPKIDLNTPIGLQRIVNNDPLKYDKRLISNGPSSFNCIRTIEGISDICVKVNFQELFDKNIKAVIMSKSDEEAQKYLDRFYKYRNKIKYMEASK